MELPVMRTQTKKEQNSLSPANALKLLQEGNERFRANLRVNRDLLKQVNETDNGQWPFAAVLSCIDSRTSAELIFDQGLGDIFSVRIAGNVVNEDILGSLEFACKVAGAKAIVVLGHSHCGAIKGACDGVELGHLTGLLKKIRPAVEAASISRDLESQTSADPEFVDEVARENVKRSVETILDRSTVLHEMHEVGDIDVVGGMYCVATGQVDFTDTEVSQ
jgi:carbonic anhydrase